MVRCPSGKGETHDQVDATLRNGHTTVSHGRVRERIELTDEWQMSMSIGVDAQIEQFNVDC